MVILYLIFKRKVNRGKLKLEGDRELVQFKFKDSLYIIIINITLTYHFLFRMIYFFPYMIWYFHYLSLILPGNNEP